MNKTDLVNAVSAKTEVNKVTSKQVIEAAIEAVVEALKAGEKVSLVGFGTFSVTDRVGREGINPATGQPITIAAKKVAKFKAGSELDSAINQ